MVKKKKKIVIKKRKKWHEIRLKVDELTYDEWNEVKKKILEKYGKEYESNTWVFKKVLEIVKDVLEKSLSFD